MHYAIVRRPGVEIEHRLARGSQTGHEFVATVRVLDEEQREVGRETLAEPDIIPVGLGHSVAKPLMRDLVDDHVAPAHRTIARHAAGAVEDR